MTYYDACTIAQETREKGGASIDIRGNNYRGALGYAVSIFKDRQRILDGYATTEDIDQYIHDNIDVLNDDSVFVGTWYHNGQTYIDCSVFVVGKYAAIGLGADHGQEAVYDLFNEHDVPVEATK